MGSFLSQEFFGGDGEPARVRSPRSANGREQLAEQAVKLTRPNFIGGCILPLLGNSRGAWEEGCKTTVLQNTGTGRLTLQYEFGTTTLLAKLYTDELGIRSYEVLRALWNSGFDCHALYQVPEPLGFLPDQNLLIMRRVPGKPISAALEGDTSVDLIGGSRSAARWLAALHQSSLRLGQPEPDWESLRLFRMTSRVIKATSAQPEHVDIVRDLLDLITERILKLPERRGLVQTHGRYHHDHVFVSEKSVAVIDLDRCRVGDAGKDVAEFLRVLRPVAFKRAFDMALVEKATSTFLKEYLSLVPDATVSLGCYWSASMFYSFLGTLKKQHNKEKREWQEMLDFYVREMKLTLDIA